MTIKELTSLIKKKLTNGESHYVHLSNLYKPRGKRSIAVGIYRSYGLAARSLYCGHLEMDYSGKILRVFTREKGDRKLDSLLNKKVDLNSYRFEYEKIILSRPVGVEAADVLGRVDEKGRAKIYKLADYAKLKMPREYHGNRSVLTPYGGYELAEIFMNLSQQYKDCLKAGEIRQNGMTEYRLVFEIGKYRVLMTLQQFFNYDLKVVVTHKKTNTRIMLLQDEDVSVLPELLSQLKRKKLSEENRVRRLSICQGARYQTITQIKAGIYQVSIAFDSWERKRPTGRFDFVFDLNRKTVRCPNGKRSKKFIPNLLNSLNERIRELESEPLKYVA